MADRFSLKDHLFNAETVAQLGGHFEMAGVFRADPFVQDVMAQMPALELMARVQMIAEVLTAHLPPEFPAAADAITAALPPPLDPTLSDDDFGHFIYAPLGVYVEKHGVADHRDRSLDLLEQITQRFSMEFAIRAFLNHWPDATLERMQNWVGHDHYHVRRLVSEGTRPKLPWGKAVRLEAAQTLPLLDQLHGDPTRFVTRSVANHLNDIARTDPDAVITRLQGWQKADAQSSKELTWMRKHALRNLIKAGHAGAMLHLGYRPDLPVELIDFTITPATIPRGGTAVIAVTLTTVTDAPLIVDYVIDFVKANGKTAPKVFKLKVLDAKAGKPLVLKKKQVFKDNATTFTLHPGAHMLHVQMNGRIIGSQGFILT
ncbi:DNA alkylation repair protein [Loktanella agnita]|uniref:DNA alkylation repair protein n=1 Tax=Loktanella agnita TaxID=287097 RepID=UPI003986DD87